MQKFAFQYSFLITLNLIFVASLMLTLIYMYWMLPRIKKQRIRLGFQFAGYGICIYVASILFFTLNDGQYQKMAAFYKLTASTGQIEMSSEVRK